MEVEDKGRKEYGCLSEDDMLAVEMRSSNSRDEELGTIGILATVGHRKEARLGVLEVKAFVLEAITWMSIKCFRRLQSVPRTWRRRWTPHRCHSDW